MVVPLPVGSWLADGVGAAGWQAGGKTSHVGRASHRPVGVRERVNVYVCVGQGSLRGRRGCVCKRGWGGGGMRVRGKVSENEC